MLKLVKIVLITFGSFVLIGIIGVSLLMIGQKKVLKVDIDHVDLTTIEDGTYKGVYKSFRWSNEVEVTIDDHQITDIKIIDDILFKRDEVSEELIGKVIDEQSIEVDGVAGATVTSNAYLKAIEDALKEANE